SALLMPAETIRTAFVAPWTPGKHAELAMRLKVTPRALAYRLHGLRLVDAGASSELGAMSEAQAARNTGTLEDHERNIRQANQARPPGLLCRDALAAYDAGLTTVRPYAHLLGVNPDVVRRALDDDSGLPPRGT
ncbi:MAG: ImmA/IrrE family metallo-endopeptidase, partial [Phycicoccus sp.]